jgi:hypothetical protein
VTMHLVDLAIVAIEGVRTINDDTVSFVHKGESPGILHYDGRHFVLVMDGTIIDDREPSPEETEIIELIFSKAPT